MIIQPQPDSEPLDIDKITDLVERLERMNKTEQEAFLYIFLKKHYQGDIFFLFRKVNGNVGKI